MVKVVFVPNVREGDAGCLATIEELDLEVGAPSREEALKHLVPLVRANCRALTEMNEAAVLAAGATAKQYALAMTVMDLGFEVRDEVLEPKQLAAQLEKVPHLAGNDGKRTIDGPMFRVWIVKEHQSPFEANQCRSLGGRCAFDTVMQLIQIPA